MPAPSQSPAEQTTDAPVGSPAQGRELRARGRATVRRLLDAGIEVFADRGFHAARVDDVVKLAATSHGTFYLYFSNKEDLFRTLVGEVAEEMQSVADSLEPVTDDSAGREVLRSWIERFCEVYEHHGAVVRAWTEAEISNTELGDMGEGVLGNFTTVLADRLPPARDGRPDPQIAALAIVAMLERLNYYVMTGSVAIGRDSMIATLTDVTHAVLMGADSQPMNRAHGGR